MLETILTFIANNVEKTIFFVLISGVMAFVLYAGLSKLPEDEHTTK